MILLSELSRRRIRSINKLIRVGRTEPVVVIRVDKDKGYIDLSKRRVSREDMERCLEQVSKAKVRVITRWGERIWTLCNLKSVNCSHSLQSKLRVSNLRDDY